MDNLAFDRAVAERVRVDAIQARKDRRAKRWRFAWTLIRVVGLALLLAAAYAIGRASVLVNC